jgi:hypothetical protein
MTASNPPEPSDALGTTFCAANFELRETFSTDNTLIIIPKASDVHHNGTAALC